MMVIRAMDFCHQRSVFLCNHIVRENNGKDINGTQVSDPLAARFATSHPVTSSMCSVKVCSHETLPLRDEVVGQPRYDSIVAVSTERWAEFFQPLEVPNEEMDELWQLSQFLLGERGRRLQIADFLREPPHKQLLRPRCTLNYLTMQEKVLHKILGDTRLELEETCCLGHFWRHKSPLRETHGRTFLCRLHTI